MALPSTIAPSLITFDWSGTDRRGADMKGEVLSVTEGAARAELRKQGINIVKLKARRKKLFGKVGKKITGRDIAIVSRQMATMMQSGVPLVGALDIMAGGHPNVRMVNLLAALRDEVASGSALHEALAMHPLYFDTLFVNLVHAGENAGVLDTILDTVATYKERMETLRGKIKKALFYPIAVVFVALIVSSILLIYVVPQFRSLFEGFGADLPAFTQMVVNMSDFLIAYWWIIFGAAGGGGYMLLQTYKRSAMLQDKVDRVMLRFPVIGKILNGSAVARFARTLAITFRAGVPLVEALETVAGATGSSTYGKAIMRVREDVSAGYPLNASMKQTGMFPHMVVQMTAIGEEAGALDAMLQKVAEFYEEEVNNAVDALASLLEPFIMVLIGALVGGMVIAMYLPIFKLASVV